MIKILVVVPYEELYDEVRRYLASVDTGDFIVELQHFIGSEDQVIKDCDADIVVARGITCKALVRQNPAIHEVEISISGSDLIAALWQSRMTYRAKRVGVVLTDPSICDPAHILDLTGITVHLRTAENERELYAAIEELAALGIDAFIGGLTLCRHCDDRGYDYTHIKSGSEAVSRALNEALAAARSLSRERTRATLVAAVLNSAEDAMFALNKEGLVIAANAQASSLLLGDRELPLEGRRIAELLPAGEGTAFLPEGSGTEALRRIRDQLCLVKTAPIAVGDESLGVLLTCRNVEALREAERKIRKELGQKGLVAHYRFGDIIHRSAAMQTLVASAYKYSQVDSSVLIIGETGTGKELFAQSIHNASRRNAQPFVAVNCAALPEPLLESELFGYAEGAFSGAAKGGRIGLFELAHKGTIFLDEIGEMPLSLQAKLLRVLQEREIRKIGGDTVVPVDVRVISATNIDILERVRSHSFREDLYYRINLLAIKVPPLRRRQEDIDLILHYFLRKFSQEAGKPVPRLEAEVEEAVRAYPWSGNIRELRAFCERLVILNEQASIDLDCIQGLALLDDWDARREAAPEGLAPDEAESLGAGRGPSRPGFLSRRLAESGLDRKAFAEALGMSRTTLWRKLREEEEA